jgi:hypothetical protein
LTPLLLNEPATNDFSEASMRQTIRALLALMAFWPELAATAGEPSVIATVESSLGTGSGQIRQFAFDGDPATFFASEGPAKPGDHLTLWFEKPVTLHSVSVSTGRADGTDKLDAGVLEVSGNGKTFSEIGKFTDGAVVEAKGRKILAIRIKPGGNLDHPLVIRELTIDSKPSVTTFKYPVEFVVDVTDAPEMKSWADKVARLCEAWYPRINEELRTDGYKPPTVITMSLKSSYNGVAMAGGGRITGSVKFFKAHPDDLGAMIHETCHIVQRYRSRNNPGWLVEGVADYVRFFKYEPPNKIGPIDAENAHYDNSYRVTARFLAYLTKKYDKEIVLKLNKLMREGNYKEEVFKELTGKDLKALDEEWRATLKR